MKRHIQTTMSAPWHLVSARLLTTALCALASTAGSAHAGDTVRVSVSGAGIAADADSNVPAIDRAGRMVAFISAATNLVPGDTNAADDIFVHDRRLGTTTRVSVDGTGLQADGDSLLPSLSRDGKTLSFSSLATNLVIGDGNGQRDIFVHDRKTGTTTRVSVDSSGAEANHAASLSALSGDGRVVAFNADASNLVAGDGNGKGDVFVHDPKTGSTTRVSVTSAGDQANGVSVLAPNASLGASGRLIPFQSAATNLVASDVNGAVDVFVHDRRSGSTERVSVDSAGNEGNGSSSDSTMSDNGRVVAFVSSATNLVAGDTNGKPDVYVRDRKTGSTTRVSVAGTGAQSNGGSAKPTLSADGRFVTFSSDASNLVPDDTNGEPDVFVHDRKTGATTRASLDGAGGEANGASTFARISGNGRFVALQSAATNLVGADVNDSDDVFVHDRK